MLPKRELWFIVLSVLLALMPVRGMAAPVVQTSPRTPAAASNPSAPVQISIGGKHGCLLTASGAVQCWVITPTASSAMAATSQRQNPSPSARCLLRSRHLPPGKITPVLWRQASYCWGKNTRGS